jgi:hypothetical protein
MQEFIRENLNGANSVDEFVKMTMVGNCPACGDANTRDCENSPLNDICVGM